MRKVINKGRGTQPKLERNQKIVKQYKSGTPMADLVAEHRISPARIYEILRQMGVRRNRKAGSK